MYSFSKLVYKVLAIVGHNARALATSKPCDFLVAILECFNLNLLSLSFQRIVVAVQSVSLVCVVRTTFK